MNSYIITSATIGDSGLYSVIVSNAVGSDTSDIFKIVVLVSPQIIAQPVSQMVDSGQSVSFSVTAAGSSPFSFQWKKNGIDLIGDTLNSFSITNALLSDSGNYSVVVTNAVGKITSSIGKLTVVAPVYLTKNGKYLPQTKLYVRLPDSMGVASATCKIISPDGETTIPSISNRGTRGFYFTDTANNFFSTGCQLQVTLAEKIFLSDSFAIKQILLASPQMGGSYKIGDTLSVKWVANSSITAVVISFIIGRKSASVCPGYLTSGDIGWQNYKWVIPDSVEVTAGVYTGSVMSTVSMDCKIQVSQYGSLLSYQVDRMDLPFSITQ